MATPDIMSKSIPNPKTPEPPRSQSEGKTRSAYFPGDMWDALKTAAAEARTGVGTIICEALKNHKPVAKHLK